MSSLWRRVLIVFGIVILAAGGVFAFIYFNPEARREREEAEDTRRFLNNLEALKQESARDIYGGQTPEETLNLFIAALRSGDVVAAAKFFEGEPDFDTGYLSWEKFERELRRIQTDGNVMEFADDLEEYDRTSTDDMGIGYFTYLDDDGEGSFQLVIRRNQYSGIWKIEDIF